MSLDKGEGVDPKPASLFLQCLAVVLCLLGIKTTLPRRSIHTTMVAAVGRNRLVFIGATQVTLEALMAGMELQI